MILTDQDFRAAPRLRCHRDDDGATIATCNPQLDRYRHDFLAFHGPNKLAIYYQDTTLRRAKAKRRWWIKQVGLHRILEDRPGDTEGFLVFACPDPSQIPKQFLRCKRGLVKNRGYFGPGGKHLPDISSVVALITEPPPAHEPAISLLLDPNITLLNSLPIYPDGVALGRLKGFAGPFSCVATDSEVRSCLKTIAAKHAITLRFFPKAGSQAVAIDPDSAAAAQALLGR